MAIYRVNKTTDYLTIGKYHLKEKNMSLKAKGLLTLFLSLPDDWDFSVMGLSKLVVESKTVINSTNKELERFGYLVRTKVKDEHGRFIGWQYDIYEKPQTKKPHSVLPQSVLPKSENSPQLSNNIELSNNKLNNNKEIYKEKYFEDEYLNDLFKDFLDLRKKLKVVNTDRAVKMIVDKLSNYDDDTKKQMIEQSIENSWKTVYPIKKKKESIDEMFERIYGDDIK